MIARSGVQGHWQFSLYVAGMTPVAMRALANLEKIGDRFLDGRYSVDVIDLLEHPDRAESDQIIAVPTLVRTFPEGKRRVLGDLSDLKKVMEGLDLEGGS